ncbi:hypothetical protein [Enterovirga sp.]|uniref:hypothetical protein n=1 Tax=Enterovirga sp. TaxID=2026350 RepID=UPI002BA58ABE|nr:hypothetical protein [Enterovirga sp.]HMO30494.1 hypothetical protein [Enterovirga sp.]
MRPLLYLWIVMAGLVPAIHERGSRLRAVYRNVRGKAWMAGTGPAMTLMREQAELI